jgi:hypothetical protein
MKTGSASRCSGRFPARGRRQPSDQVAVSMPAMTKTTIAQKNAYHASVVHILYPYRNSLLCNDFRYACRQWVGFQPLTQRCVTNPFAVLTVRDRNFTLRDTPPRRRITISGRIGGARHGAVELSGACHTGTPDVFVSLGGSAPFRGLAALPRPQRSRVCFAEHPLEYLAGWVAWNFLGEDHLFRELVAR